MRSLPFLLLLSLVAVPVDAAPHAKRHHPKHVTNVEHPKHARDVEKTRDRGTERVYFSPTDVRVIHEYYAPRYRTLPPGLQKKLYRTGQLPPGWQRKLQPMPVVVERRLAPLPSDYRRGVIDGYAVVYDPRRQVIVDVAPVWR
jgi:hypothetical protein